MVTGRSGKTAQWGQSHAAKGDDLSVIPGREGTPANCLLTSTDMLQHARVCVCVCVCVRTHVHTHLNINNRETQLVIYRIAITVGTKWDV